MTPRILPNRKIEGISAVLLHFHADSIPDFDGSLAHVERAGKADFVELGRMLLTYPNKIADILKDKLLQRKRICRTFSDCTTTPRNGMVSGYYPLDAFYKERPEGETLKKVKMEK